MESPIDTSSKDITLSEEWCRDQEERLVYWDSMCERKKGNHITLSREWCKEHTDRLINWEILCRYLKGESGVPMQALNLCDRIGVSKTYVTTLIKSVREKLNPEDNAE